MESEALRNVRTMRHVRTGLEIANRHPVRTTNSLSKTADEIVRLNSLTDRQMERALARERQRSATLEASVEKSRRRMLQSREKLAATVNRNRALTVLRKELQKARCQGTSAHVISSEASEKTSRVMDLDY